MVSHCQQVTSHRKYMDAAQPQVEEKVRQEKQANPAFNPYYLSIHKVGGWGEEGEGLGGADACEVAGWVTVEAKASARSASPAYALSQQA